MRPGGEEETHGRVTAATPHSERPMNTDLSGAGSGDDHDEDWAGRLEGGVVVRETVEVVMVLARGEAGSAGGRLVLQQYCFEADTCVESLPSSNQYLSF